MDTTRLRTATAIQFAKFLAVGVVNTAFGYGIFALLIFAGVGAIPSLVVTYVVGVMFNFFTTSHFVFNQFHASVLLRFVAGYVIIFLVNAAIYETLSATGITPLVAQAICLPIVALFAFLLFKFHVFNPRTRRV